MPIALETLIVAHMFYYTAVFYLLSSFAPSAPAPRLKAGGLRRSLIIMSDMLSIRAPITPELSLLNDFAPPDWSTDLSVIFSFHFDQPYFYPIVAELDGKVVGCADGLLQGVVGWLGNIIVLPEFRSRGIGSALTAHLVEFFHSQGYKHQILIATKLGEPVYRKLGFEVASYYIFLKREGKPTPEAVADIRPLESRDTDFIFALDRAVTGETRQPFLSRFMAGGWVHVSPSGLVDGFYLPDLANGPVLAANDTAGLALLRFKLGQNTQTIVIPEANRTALDFLLSSGFVETNRAPRMVLGEDASWHPERVYSRGSGFCG